MSSSTSKDATGEGSRESHDGDSTGGREDDVPLLEYSSTDDHGGEVKDKGNQTPVRRPHVLNGRATPKNTPMRLKLGVLTTIVIIVVSLIFILRPPQGPQYSAARLVDLKSDLHLFFHNELDGRSTERNESAVSLFEPKPYDEAAHACLLLGETLVDFDAILDEGERNLEKKRIGNLLKYRKYFEKNSADTRYWVNGHRCLLSNGTVTSHCAERLPALCSQSMPIPTATSLDRSKRWHLTMPFGKHEITGYRDRRTFRFEGIRYGVIPQRFSHSSMLDFTAENVDALQVDATKFGTECLQLDMHNDLTPKGGEDCLFLNVFTPYIPGRSVSNSTEERLKPVMVFIHGGAFTGGAGSDVLYDGGNVASRGDIVVVTLNYRLGTLGFLALEDESTTGNWGLGDQVTALKWVKTHIQYFGGDPNKVTVAGQSAGAASIKALLGSEETKGLFRAAILQSLPSGLGLSANFLAYIDIKTAAEVAGNSILKSSGCSDVACLRNLDAHAFLKEEQARVIVRDDILVPYHGLPTDGSIEKYPLIMGDMRDEAAAWVGPNPGYTATQYLLDAGIPEDFAVNLVDSNTFVPQRNSSTDESEYDIAVHVATDVMARCLNRALATVDNAFSDVWYYQLERGHPDAGSEQCLPEPTEEYPDGDPTSESYYRCHGADIPYTFGNIDFLDLPDRDGHDIALSQYIVDYWTYFIRTQDPNPAPEFYKLRGHASTARFGQWKPVRESGGLRHLDFDGKDETFDDLTQCAELGFPLDFYRNDGA